MSNTPLASIDAAVPSQASNPGLQALVQALRQFRDQRDWAGFHTYKDLLISISLEANELLELAQWRTEAEMEHALKPESSPGLHQALQDEMADVMLYLLQLADKAGIDLQQACLHKMQKNAQKYPCPPGKA